MKYYPVNLNIRNRNCLVVGGGSVGTRKVASLLACGANVTVVSPLVSEELEKRHRCGEICLNVRNYEKSDLDRMFLVIGATDDEALNRQVHADAEGQHKLCNIADRPEICNFILPAVVNRGDLTIAVSTSGKSPAFAKSLRKQLERQFGEEYETFLRLMGKIREKLLAGDHAPEAHKPIFERLIDARLLDMIKHRQTEQMDRLLLENLGPGYGFTELMGHAPEDLP